METIVRANEEILSNNKPVQKFRAGSIIVNIWENESKESGKKYHTISLDRIYKDKNDIWQHTGSLRLNDLPRANLLLQKAYEWLSFNTDN